MDVLLQSLIFSNGRYEFITHNTESLDNLLNGRQITKANKYFSELKQRYIHLAHCIKQSQQSESSVSGSQVTMEGTELSHFGVDVLRSF